MMRSLFAGVSGLKNHQTRMDVIGNNIANVNTVGFKKSRVTFQDMLSQTLRSASSPQSGRGGTNPMQVGLGMTLASIDTIQTAGSPQSTGKNTDLSIEGEGFFILTDGTNFFYTRAGNFDFDFNKSLVNTSNGMVVTGILADNSGIIKPEGDIVDINLASKMSSSPQATSTIEFAKNLDTRDLPKTGVNTGVAHTQGATTTVALNATKLPVTKVEISGLTEDTDYTVDYQTGEVTILSTTADGPYDINFWEPNYQLPSVVYDSKGVTHILNLLYTKIGPNTWEVDTQIDNKFQADGKGTLVFDAGTGRLNEALSSVEHVTFPIQHAVPPGDALDLDITLNFTNMTEYAGDYTTVAFSQDGYAAGDLQSVSVDPTGTISGSFSNGQNRKLAQLAVATFSNPAGLTKVGNNMFMYSYNSGEPDKGIPGVAGRGVIKPETLEMSNVDLSQEFVDMIITQRGFQANSRVITTSDQILEELVNLRR
jgi:flagellar hook protein FlgE